MHRVRVDRAVGVASRRGEDAEGSLHFIGILVVAIAAVNLLLIVWEGSYTPFLTSCH